MHIACHNIMHIVIESIASNIFITVGKSFDIHAISFYLARKDNKTSGRTPQVLFVVRTRQERERAPCAENSFS